MDCDLRLPQIAEQLVGVPTDLSFASLQEQTVEHIVNIPVPRGRGSSGSGGGLRGFLPGQNPAAVVEQSVDIPVLGGAIHDLHPDPGSPASSAVLRDEAFQAFFRTFPRSQKSTQSAGSPSPRVPGSSSSWTPAAYEAHHVVRDDLWVQIMTDDRPYFWHRQERRAVWRMPPGTRPPWMRMTDGLFVHIETQNVLQSISGMH